MQHDGERRNVRNSLEILANLLYLVEREGTLSERQKEYLRRAEDEVAYLAITLKLAN